MSLRVTAAATVAAALLIAPAAASAATQMFTASIPQNGTFTINTFDTSLGALTGVTLELDTTGFIAITIFNFGAPNAPYLFAQTQVSETVTGLGGTLTNSYTETSNGGTLPLGNFQLNTLPGGNVSSTVSSALNSGLFAGFETAGAGTLSYTSAFGPNFTSSITPGAPGELVSGTGSLVSGSFSVTYDYTAAAGGVPEPATWALMILGFGGAGAMLRGRRRALA
jgi:hypothetical protein